MMWENGKLSLSCFELTLLPISPSPPISLPRFAAQSIRVQRVCARAQPACVAAGPTVWALPPWIPLSHPPLRELPLPWSYHQVGVSPQHCLVSKLWEESLKRWRDDEIGERSEGGRNGSAGKGEIKVKNGQTWVVQRGKLSHSGSVWADNSSITIQHKGLRGFRCITTGTGEMMKYELETPLWMLSRHRGRFLLLKGFTAANTFSILILEYFSAILHGVRFKLFYLFQWVQLHLLRVTSQCSTLLGLIAWWCSKWRTHTLTYTHSNTWKFWGDPFEF